MYCRNCGTYVNGTEELCEACRAEMIIHKNQNAPVADMSAEGRGAAICSAVLGGVSLFLAGMALGFATAEALAGVVICGMGSLACAIISIIKGIAGIKAFRRACKENARKPIASLICGIAGVSLSGVALVYLFIVFVAAIAIAAEGGRSYRYY